MISYKDRIFCPYSDACNQKDKFSKVFLRGDKKQAIKLKLPIMYSMSVPRCFNEVASGVYEFTVSVTYDPQSYLSKHIDIIDDFGALNYTAGVVIIDEKEMIVMQYIFETQNEAIEFKLRYI